MRDGPECPRCGAFLPVPLPDRSPGCPGCPAPLPFSFARSRFAYEDTVRDGLLRAKYEGGGRAAEGVARRLHEAISGPWSGLLPDRIRPPVVPVPLSPRKYLLRGFNFPARVGQELARLRGLPFAPRMLHRKRSGVPQAGLPRSAREANVRNAFVVPRGADVPRAVVLVDDVYTSGATVSACSRALRAAGAEHIVVLTAARALP